MPSTKEEQAGQARDGKHVYVFSHKEHGKFHGAVFGVVSGHKLGLGFRHIKRDAVGFRVGRHQVNKETDDLGKDKPVRDMRIMSAHNPMTALAEHDLTQAEASGE